MKNLIILLSLIVSFTASARSFKKVSYSANVLLSGMDIDPRSELSELDISGGRLFVNPFMGIIELSLTTTPDCSGGRFCPDVLYTRPIKLNISSVPETDSCNIKKYVAVSEPGKKYEELVIFDYSKTICELPLKSSTVIYYITTAGPLKIADRLYADDFVEQIH